MLTVPPTTGLDSWAQWAERDPRPFGWLTIDQQHNDPVVLLRGMAAALDRVEPSAHPVRPRSGRAPSSWKLGVLGQQADELRTQLDTMRGDAIGASSLTVAEVRLFRLLGSHYSFREIGGRLYLSQHTVKSQAMSIYRKFGVSSRSQAIQRGRDLGLFEE